jgi:hypothetical protein
MSLPACQQRVLDDMEVALRASEPHLAGMFSIFTRLNRDEPVGMERLIRKRARWLRPGSAVYAIVLIPVMFAAIITGVLLGGSARGATACETSYSMGGGSPLVPRPSCPPPAKTATSRLRNVSCAIAAARFTARSGAEQASSPPALAGATAAGPPGTC